MPKPSDRIADDANRPDESALWYKLHESRWHLRNLAGLEQPLADAIASLPESEEPPADLLFPFKFALSAFLCSTGSLIYYFERALKRERLEWLCEKRKGEHFKAFYYARNFEVHQNMVITGTSRVLMSFPAPPRGPRIVVFFDRLAPFGEVRMSYANEPVLELAEQYLSELDGCIREARENGYFREPPTCGT